MNERIEKFLEDATEIYDNPNTGISRAVVDYKIFAEWIVRECIQVVDGMADPEEDSDRYVWALHNASEKIKEHFGVEE